MAALFLTRITQNGPGSGSAVEEGLIQAVVDTNTIRSIATFGAPDGFACKARWRRHSRSTSSHLNAAGGFVRSPRRACLTARVDCDCYDKRAARCRLSYRLRAAALPRLSSQSPRDKLNEAILLIVLVCESAAPRSESNTRASRSNRTSAFMTRPEAGRRPVPHFLNAVGGY